MEDHDITGIIIAAIPGIIALVLALITFAEKRLEKRDAKIIADKLAEAKMKEDEKARIYREVANQLALENERKANGLEDRLNKLEDELSSAYTEIKRLKCAKNRTTKIA